MVERAGHMHMLLKVVLVVGLLFTGVGCSGESVARKRDLLVFALDYHNVSSSNQGEVAWADFDSLRAQYPMLADRIERGEVIVVWDAVLDAQSEEVMAYEKQVSASSGLVVLCNAEVRKVTAADFKQMKLAATTTIPFQTAEQVAFTGHNPDDEASYVRIMGIRGLRMDLPDEMEWSEAQTGFVEPNADFIVQATSLPGLNLRGAMRIAHKVMRSRNVDTANLREVSNTSFQGRLIEFESEGLHQELLVLSDESKTRSVMISAISKSGSESAKRTRALMLTVDWQPDYLPDFTVDSAARDKLQSALEFAMEDGLRKAYITLQYPIMDLTISTQIPRESTVMKFGTARIALNPTSAFEVNRHELVWMTDSDGKEGFAMRRRQ